MKTSPQIKVTVQFSYSYAPVSYTHLDVYKRQVVTECVYQALVDYNQVGNVDVVGFYYSDVILDGISKGIISSAIALDMDEIGRYSVNALEEFSSLGHTSNYYSVGQHVITRSNVGAYRTEGN